jgi:hypothetical protein
MVWQRVMTYCANPRLPGPGDRRDAVPALAGPGLTPAGTAWGRHQHVQPLPVIGALIASTARVHGMAVVTRNVRDFELAGVQVPDPFAA